MVRRSILAFIAIFLSLTLVVPAFAGGWAVITLDSLPGEIVAEQPLTIGFVVRQHGRTPLTGLDPTIRLVHSSTGERLTFHAVDEGAAGHYSATFALPESGTWGWSIQAFTMDQPMPDLSVGQPAAQASTQQLSGKTGSPIIDLLPSGSLWMILAGIIAVGIGMFTMLRRRSRWALASIVLGCLIGVAGFARAGIAAAASRSAEADKSVSTTAVVNLREQGEALFIAKGCLSCHINTRVDSRYLVFSTEMGPDLTGYKTSPEYLHLWLTDPLAVKPKTEMPNLGLSQTEIDALTAFLLPDDQD